MRMPDLESERLIIRPFTMDDLDAIHRILDVELEHTAGDEAAHALEHRRSWLEWSVRNYEELARLIQPPLGDRAVVPKESGELIGSVGISLMIAPFGQIPAVQALGATLPPPRYTSEVALFYAISSRHQNRGYATEAARALIDYLFAELHLARVIAATEYTNLASQAVMRRLGMTLDRNPLTDPFWLQCVGVLENPQTA